MAIINSVLGPMDTADLGFTLSHEHVIVSSAGIQQVYPEFIDRAGTIERGIRALKAAYDEGLRSMVDVSTLDLGRDVRPHRGGVARVGREHRLRDRHLARHPARVLVGRRPTRSRGYTSARLRKASKARASRRGLSRSPTTWAALRRRARLSCARRLGRIGRRACQSPRTLGRRSASAISKSPFSRTRAST